GQTPLLELAFHTGAADDPQAEARDLLVDILTSGESSRLYRRLVDQDRLAVDVSGSVSPEGFDPGLIKLSVTLSPVKGPEAAEALATARAAPASAPGINLPPSREVRLQNGAFVILGGKHDVPLIAFYALLRGGGVGDPAGKEGVAALTGELLRKGAGKRSAQD